MKLSLKSIEKLAILLFLLTAVASERVVLKLDYGGRGIISPLLILSFTLIFFLILYRFSYVISFINSNNMHISILFLCILSFLPIFGIILNNYPTHTFFNSIFTVYYLFSLFFGYYVYRRKKFILKFFKITFLILIFISFLTALLQYLDMNFSNNNPFSYISSRLREWDFEIQKLYSEDYILAGRSIGLFINPNTLGVYSILILGYYSFFFGKWRIYVLLISICVGFFSGSRGTLTAFFASLMYYFFINFYIIKQKYVSRKRILSLFLYFLLICIVFLLTINQGSFSELLEERRYDGIINVLSGGISQDDNLNGRYMTWMQAFNFIDENPFGTLGPTLLKSGLSSDNQYISYLLQGGILLLLYYIIFLLRNMFLFNLKITSITMVIVAISVNSMTASAVDYTCFSLFWFLLGYSIEDIRSKT